MDYVRKIAHEIKTLKIQGAQAVAEAAIKAWKRAKDKATARKILESARPTEPMLRNVLRYLASGKDPDSLLKQLEKDKEKIRLFGMRKIRNGYVIYTHCHSSTVIAVLKEAKKRGKRFEVHVTETRPLFQGRITAKELAKVNIPVKFFIDSAMRLALKKADLVLLGCDAITSEGIIINKIGSALAVEIANRYDVPIYVCTHSWKFDPLTELGFYEEIEKRPGKEIWERPPKGVEIVNYAFEQISPDLVTGVICELGVLKPEAFFRQFEKAYPFLMVKE